MKLVDAFIGPIQSKYSAVAIFSALIIVCIAILFSKTKMPFSQKLGAATMLFLVSLPSVLYILFQLTCIVTGSSDETPWCGIYAWIIVAFTILYAILVVVIAMMSLTATKNMAATESFYANRERYEKFANKILTESEPVTEELAVAATNVHHESEEEDPMMETFVDPSKDLMSGVKRLTGLDLVLPMTEGFTSCGAPVPTVGQQ